MPTDTDAADEALARRIWQELDRATQERDHAWRAPVLCTVDAEHTPQARTVVLRSADPELGELRVFTDARSPKVVELRLRPLAVLVFWSPLLRWQLRATVTVAVLEEGPSVDAAWARVRTSAAAGDYLAPVAPGQPLPPMGTRAAESEHGHHLAVLAAQVRALDWLELGGNGVHQRCRITQDGVQRLVP